MNISLDGILGKQNSMTTQTDAANAASVMNVSKNSLVLSILNRFHVGDTISGQVKSVNGSQILLNVGDEVEIQAKIDGALEFQPGKKMLFEVKNNHDGKITLSPLFTNMASEKNGVEGALKAAGMALSMENIQMVNSMIEEGMPIDKASLWEMGKQIHLFPQALPSTIVGLRAMHMEINMPNVSGYESMRNLQHQIIHNIDFFVQGLETDIVKAIEVGETKQVGEILNKLLQLIQSFHQPLKNESTIQEPLVPLENAQMQLIEAIGTDEVSVNLSDNGLGKDLSAIPLYQSIESLVQDESMSLGSDTKEGMLFLENVKQSLTLLRENIINEWTISPEQFSNKTYVKDFYKKVSDQISKIYQLLSNTERNDLMSLKSISNMHQNMQFMEAVNQAYPYLQIPLKATMDQAHGELYVYSRKAGKIDEDGSCSALLHLEMKNLGDIDIYVRLKEQNVSTQFVLENEELLDFMDEHMNILSERLEKKGYHLSSEFKMNQDIKVSDPHNRLKGTTSNHQLISYTAFDVRA